MAVVKAPFGTLKDNYLFTMVAAKKQAMDPKKRIDLGVGDIDLPLSGVIALAIERAVAEMGSADGKRGYGPELGYDFLKDAILQNVYESFAFTADELIIGDGIATEIGLIASLFGEEARICMQDPCYPAYFESAQVFGHAERIVWAPCSAEGAFCAEPPEKPADLIYLCSPHNPTGVALNRCALKRWVDYAKQHNAIILFDAAYQAFVSSDDVPHSIYEIDGAQEVAIELCSFSKSAGFTGLRCGYTLIPRAIQVQVGGEMRPLLDIYSRFKSMMHNGVAYPLQRGAAASLSGAGKLEVERQIAIYRESMHIMRTGLLSLGFDVWGGIDCPYIWWRVPNEESSAAFFNTLIDDLGIVSVPGSGFGPSGEGYVRLSCFIQPEVARQAIKTLTRLQVPCP